MSTEDEMVRRVAVTLEVQRMKAPGSLEVASKELIAAMRACAPQVGWYSACGFPLGLDEYSDGADEPRLPLYTIPPDAAARIAELEAKIAELQTCTHPQRRRYRNGSR